MKKTIIAVIALFAICASQPEDTLSLAFIQGIIETLSDSQNVSPGEKVFLTRLSNKRAETYDVPIVWNERVRNALQYFYQRTLTGLFNQWVHRTGYYVPVMRQMFANAGLPQDLAYLPILESDFDVHAYSKAHAAGIWQFIPSTGRKGGLRQNYWIDERRDPLKATGAAISYFSDLYTTFSNWHIALASYNYGEDRMERVIGKTDNTFDYWSLKLPKETMNYVPLFLSAIVIAKNPDAFGITMQNSMVFDPDTVSISDCVEMAVIADGIKVPLDTLAFINPHILNGRTPPDMENVRLYLPKGYTAAFQEFYKNLPDDKKTKFYRYKIQNGENLLQIAKNFNVPAQYLREINNMKSDKVSGGEHLLIAVPVGYTVPSSLLAHINISEEMEPSVNGIPTGEKKGGKK